MRFLSVCSGIEAASQAWSGDPARGGLGWTAAAFSEVEPFPSAVLEHRWGAAPSWGTGVPNLGDMNTITEADLERLGDVALLVGGTPCQSFSVAGLRRGLADPRGNLALRFLQLASSLRPRWVVWENVPGVLTAQGGGAFGTFLGGLEECGYGWAYRVLDAQFFGLAQRRKRVFVVGHLGDWRPAAAVLLEREGMSGDPPPSRAPRAGAAGTLAGGSRGGGFDPAPDGAAEGFLQPEVAKSLLAPQNGKGGSYRGDTDTDTDTLLVSQPYQVHSHNSEGNRRHAHETDVAAPLDSRTDSVVGQGGTAIVEPVAFRKVRRAADETDDETWEGDGLANTLNGFDVGDARTTHAVVEPDLADPILGSEGKTYSHEGNGFRMHNVVTSRLRVRRLTPRECERLQGFPDDYTKIPWRIWKECRRRGDSYEAELARRGMRLREPAGEECPDGPRYRALGNSMAVPVMAWLGRRIDFLDRRLFAGKVPA